MKVVQIYVFQSGIQQNLNAQRSGPHRTTEELAWLSRCCFAVEMLLLRLFGPEGTKNMEWLDAWSHSLKRLLAFFQN